MAWNAAALVGDHDRNAAFSVAVTVPTADADRTAVGGRSIDGVHQQIGDDLPDLALQTHNGQPRLEIQRAPEAA